jgi:hypothetical protein
MADIMTYRGKLMQIDRHGLNKNPEIGPIAKASFEEVMNIFTKAALFAEKDNMKGVSANILAGLFCKSVTICFDILMDEDKLLEQIDMPQFMNLDVNELMNGTVNVDKIFNETYDYKEVNEDVKDDDFNFGFGMENKEQFVLDSKIKAEKLVLSDNEEEENNTIFTKIVVEEPPDYRNDIPQEYRNDNQENDIPAEESNESKGDINFDALEVNEIPDYGEQKEEQKEEVAEVIQEPSPKKKVVRKKKEPVSVAETSETINVATEEVPTVSKKIVRKKKV